MDIAGTCLVSKVELESQSFLSGSACCLEVQCQTEIRLKSTPTINTHIRVYMHYVYVNVGVYLYIYIYISLSLSLYAYYTMITPCTAPSGTTHEIPS